MESRPNETHVFADAGAVALAARKRLSELERDLSAERGALAQACEAMAQGHNDRERRRPLARLRLRRPRLFTACDVEAAARNESGHPLRDAARAESGIVKQAHSLAEIEALAMATADRGVWLSRKDVALLAMKALPAAPKDLSTSVFERANKNAGAAKNSDCVMRIPRAAVACGTTVYLPRYTVAHVEGCELVIPLPKFVMLTYLADATCARCGLEGVEFRVHAKGSHLDAHFVSPEGTRMSVDHVVPVSAGGTDILENLTTMCQSCNKLKGSRPVQTVMAADDLEGFRWHRVPRRLLQGESRTLEAVNGRLVPRD